MDVHVALDGRKDLSSSIYRQLRQAILDGRLRPADALPPTRELARSLSVSRSTVSVAYERLWGEGLVTSRVGAGTFVSEHVTNGRHESPAPDAGGVLRPRPMWDAVPFPTLFDRPAEFDFRTGIPDGSLFPYGAWLRALREAVRAEAAGTGFYGHPAGLPGLRDAIARHIGISRGIECSAEDLVVTSGTQQALDVITRALLQPGDRIAVEDPGYPPPRYLFQTLGLRVQGVPMDRDGLIVDALPDDARLVYVTPSHQWPLGLAMSLQRRLALLDWAERHDAAIIEDDYDSEFRYGGRPLEPLRSLDSRGRVIYVSSFSKTLLPTLRLGFIVTPASLREAIRRAKWVADWHTPLTTQGALASFIDDGSFARHLRRMRSVYEERHLLVRTLLARDFAGVSVIPSGAGLHVAAIARTASTEQVREAISRAWDAGVAVMDPSLYAYDVAFRPGFLLGFGAIPSEKIEEGLRRLKACFDAVVAEGVLTSAHE